MADEAAITVAIKRDVYCAGPLFTEYERDWNEKVANRLEELGYNVFLPQRDSPQVDLSMAGWQAEMFDADAEAVKRADVIFANLNGSMADDGTSFECGLAFGLGKPIVAYRDDWRSAGDDGRGNLMLTRSAEIVALNVDAAIAYLLAHYPPTIDLTTRKVR